MTADPSIDRNGPLAEAVPAEGATGETAWLIEETWSGYIHYVHRDFDAQAWVRERDSIEQLPYAVRSTATAHGGFSITTHRREPTIPFITKIVDEAMRFSTKREADAWVAAQPSWINHGDQYQAREHSWPFIPVPAEGGVVERLLRVVRDGEGSIRRHIDGPLCAQAAALITTQSDTIARQAREIASANWRADHNAEAAAEQFRQMERVAAERDEARLPGPSSDASGLGDSGGVPGAVDYPLFVERPEHGVGAVTWCSSEEDAGPDVGISVGLGLGMSLYAGEMSPITLAEQGIDAARFDTGWWIALESDDAFIAIAAVADIETARTLIETIGIAIAPHAGNPVSPDQTQDCPSPQTDRLTREELESRLTASEAENARLREALEPFARYWKWMMALNDPEWIKLAHRDEYFTEPLTVADFRRASAAADNRQALAALKEPSS